MKFVNHIKLNLQDRHNHQLRDAVTRVDYKGFCANVVLNYYRRDSKRSLELLFHDETWNVDLLKNEVSCKNQILFDSEQRITDTYLLQMDYFINSISAKKKTFNTVSDAYEVLKICLEK